MPCITSLIFVKLLPYEVHECARLYVPGVPCCNCILQTEILRFAKILKSFRFEKNLGRTLGFPSPLRLAQGSSCLAENAICCEPVSAKKFPLTKDNIGNFSALSRHNQIKPSRKKLGFNVCRWEIVTGNEQETTGGKREMPRRSRLVRIPRNMRPARSSLTT
jgi:hypothetical protein